jgi:hypothetical protein
MPSWSKWSAVTWTLLGMVALIIVVQLGGTRTTSLADSRPRLAGGQHPLAVE